MYGFGGLLFVLFLIFDHASVFYSYTDCRTKNIHIIKSTGFVYEVNKLKKLQDTML